MCNPAMSGSVNHFFFNNFPHKSRRFGYYATCSYRVFWVKLENCRWLFETENMDRFLI